MVDIKAGEALFFNNKTIHASPPNTTNKARVGIGLGITQKAAEIRHYYLKPGTKDKLLKYKTDAGFYTKYDNPGLAKMYEAGRLIVLEGRVDSKNGKHRECIQPTIG